MHLRYTHIIYRQYQRLVGLESNLTGYVEHVSFYTIMLWASTLKWTSEICYLKNRNLFLGLNDITTTFLQQTYFRQNTSYFMIKANSKKYDIKSRSCHIKKDKRLYKWILRVVWQSWATIIYWWYKTLLSLLVFSNWQNKTTSAQQYRNPHNVRVLCLHLSVPRTWTQNPWHFEDAISETFIFIVDHPKRAV